MKCRWLKRCFFILKELLVLAVRFLGFSLLSWMLTEAILMGIRPALLTDPTSYEHAYSGLYHTLACLLVTFYFYLFLMLHKGKRFQSRYLMQTRADREQGQSFRFVRTFKETLAETCRGELWKYGVFCIWPTISCTYSLMIGYLPQEYAILEAPLFGQEGLGGLVGLGIALFRAQHIFFDVFYSVGIFCVPLGLITGSVVFITLYAFGSTLVKQAAYERALGKRNYTFVIARIILLCGVLIGIANFLIYHFNRVY